MDIRTIEDVIKFYAQQQYHEYRVFELIRTRLRLHITALLVWLFFAAKVMEKIAMTGAYGPLMEVLYWAFLSTITGSVYFIGQAYMAPSFKKMSFDNIPKDNPAEYLQQIPSFNRLNNDIRAHRCNRSIHWLLGSYVPLGFLMLLDALNY